MNAHRFTPLLPLPGFRLFAWMMLLVLLCAPLLSCAPKQPPAPDKPRPSARDAWGAFWSSQEALSKWSGYSLKASLNLSTPEKRHRITFDLWGNYGLPLRLDLHAGLGTTFAFWRVDAQGLLAYYPRQQRAFVHPDSHEATSRLGLNLPFSIQEIAGLLTGRWKGIIPTEYARVSALDTRQWGYRFPEKAAVSRVILDNRGRILRLEGQRPDTWSLTCTDHEPFGQQSLGQHFVLRTEPQGRSVLRIKELKLKAEPWPGSALQIELPQNTMFVPLEG